MPCGKIPDGIFRFLFFWLVGGFFKEKRLISRRELAKYTGGTRAKRGGIQASEQQRNKAF